MATQRNPSSFFNGGGTISGDVSFNGDLNLDDGKSITYPDDSGRQTLIEKGVTSDSAQGEDQSYDFNLGGQTLLTIRAESDGSGGIQNAQVIAQVDFVSTGTTTEVDDIVTGDFIVENADGNQVRFDATVTPVRLDFFGNNLRNIGGTPAADAGGLRLGNSVVINSRNNADTSNVRMMEVDSNDILQIGDADAASVSMNPTLNFPNITGTPSFASHDHTEGGLTQIPNLGLVNNSVTINANSGIGGGGTVSLGSSIGINVEFADGEQLLFGSTPDMSLRYDSGNDDLRWRDRINASDRMALDRTSGNLRIEGSLTEGAAL